MPISEQTYEQVALEDGDERWELVCGRLRARPPMTAQHNEIARALADELRRQLPRSQFSIAEGTARLRISSGTFYVPDLCVIPRTYVLRQREERPTRLEVYEEPLPLVVEVWSPRTGDYDMEEKLREYQRRGDLEIWRIHPHERSLVAWRRRPDGSYAMSEQRGGLARPEALPGVAVEMDTLFE
jgi:Uma2 family endonuclease